MNGMTSRAARMIGLLSTLSLCAFAQNSGVSDERVNLPEAPGSVDGVGENASSEGNQGALSYGVKIEVPQGFPGLTPQINLNYSSASGSDVLGIGWSMSSYSIERMTSKGLQEYLDTDRFAVEGSEELVALAGGTATAATYRARFEKGFVRYTWRDRGAGEAGYWTAEYPDGRIGYYGADASGTPVAAAQVAVPGSNPAKIFRWHLVSMVDRYGHAMNVTWTKDTGGVSLMDRVDYLYDNGQPRHSVRFVYEARPDFISDARPGFELRLTSRLKELRVFSGAELVRAYVLTYEAEAVSGGASRLMRINRLGRGNAAYPVIFSFAYSQTLGGACDANCAKPFVKAMGTLPGADFANGRATMIDMNGDALPDVVYSTPAGAHSFYYAKLDGEGQTSFTTTATPSAIAGPMNADFVLGTPAVQVIDVNGDGFVDITQPKTNSILCNDGSGDWVSRNVCAPAAMGTGFSGYDPVDDADSAQQDPKYVRFFDYDNDKRIDWLRTIPGAGTSSTIVIQNTTAGYVSRTVETIGPVFDDTNLQLADMNGDGLQDPVQLIVSGSVVQVQYKLNYGRGNWADTWSTITLTGLDATQASKAELQDINGDTLADVVVVTTNEVLLAINRNGDRFAPVQTINSASLGAGAIPTRQTDTLVSYADMNGNGSDDIVWFQPNGGQVSYLELFPVRPNLISRIDNGIGAVQRVSYGTSINEQRRDAEASQPWANKVPNPMIVVTAMETFVTLTGSDMGGAAAPSGLRERLSLRYHSGYYDGVEKQFRGYEGVDRQLDSDMSRDAQEPTLIVERYDVGKPDGMGPRPLFAGLKLESETWGGVTPALMQDERTTWAACPVDGTPTFFSCATVTTTVLVERDATNAATTQVEREYDGFGNVTKIRNLGVKNRGTPENPTACGACTSSGSFGEPCGAMCMGDEQYAEYEFINPGTATGNLWVIGWHKREAHGAVLGMLDDERRTYYDGPDFEGLPLGQLTKGGMSRTERRTGPGANDFTTLGRFKRDAHGNVIESIGPNGSIADSSKHRRLYTMEAAGLQLLSIQLRTGGTGVTGLKRDLVIDTAWEKVSSASNWYPVNGTTQVAAPQLTRYRYDDHGRLTRQIDPGDPETNPSIEYQFSLADPASRIVVNQRSSASSGVDIVTARCLDGKGRLFQTRYKLSNTAWHVDGFVEHDARGQVVRSYLPYRAATGDCEMAPPANVPSTSYRYDGLGRQIQETLPDGKVRRTEFGPLVSRRFSEEDTETGGAFANTPDVETYDGLGRLVSLSRVLQTGGTAALTRYEYDGRGMLSAIRDPAGHVRTQTYDLLGRLVRTDDGNGGATTTKYDPAGNPVEVTDARGVTVKEEYDGANRLVARYDAADPTNTRSTWTFDRLEGCVECTNAGDRLVRATWPGVTAAGEDRFGYDAKGNMVYTVRRVAGHDFVTRRRFDQADREVGVVFPDGTSLDTTYDGVGRPVAVSGAVTGVDYTERGELAAVRLSNGTSTDYTYDTRVRLASIKAKAADGAPFLSLDLTRSAMGTVTAVADGALAGRVRHQATYTADAWGRLTRAALPGAAGEETLDYTYDAIDNIVKVTSSLGAQSRAHVGDLAYDATRPNAVTSAGSMAIAYDAAGHVTSRGGSTFTRDLLGHLTGASGEVEASYTYANDQRVAKEEGDFTTWYLDDDFEVRDGIAVTYARVGTSRVARFETDALAATVLSDLSGDQAIDIADAWLGQAAALGLLQPSQAPSKVGALLASSARRLLMEDATYLHADHLHSLVAATTAEGAVRGEQSFYPTGTVRQAQGFVDRNGFTGQEFDEATGLIHFRHRELDPFTGRWDRPDPAFAELTIDNVRYHGQATTAYAYAGNTFQTTFDPTGLAVATKAEKQEKSTKLKGSAVTKRKIAVALAVVSTLLSVASAIASFTSSNPRDTGASWGMGLSLAGSGFQLGATATSEWSASDGDKAAKLDKEVEDMDKAAATTPPPTTPPNGSASQQTPSGNSSAPTVTPSSTTPSSSGPTSSNPPTRPPPPVPSSPPPRRPPPPPPARTPTNTQSSTPTPGTP